MVQLKVTVPNDPIRKINTVLEGERYKLRAEVLDHDSKLNVFILTCYPCKRHPKNNKFNLQLLFFLFFFRVLDFIL